MWQSQHPLCCFRCRPQGNRHCPSPLITAPGPTPADPTSGPAALPPLQDRIIVPRGPGLSAAKYVSCEPNMCQTDFDTPPLSSLGASWKPFTTPEDSGDCPVSGAQQNALGFLSTSGLCQVTTALLRIAPSVLSSSSSILASAQGSSCSFCLSVGWVTTPHALVAALPTTRWPTSSVAPHILWTWPQGICGQHPSR